MARRNEFYVRVARTIFFLPREHKIHIFKLTCNVLFTILKAVMTAFLKIFRRFPTTFRRFPKIFQNCFKGQTNVPDNFTNISEGFRRFAKTSEDEPKIFDDTPTNLSTILETNVIAVKSSISSHVRISYLHM